MERATDPYWIERAEGLLREYCAKLSLDSISIFKENGRLLYSTDSEIKEPENATPLFETLDAINYAFLFRPVNTIIIHNYEKCIIIQSIFPEDWGIVEGWIVSLGNSSDLRLDEILRELIEIQTKNPEHDISHQLLLENNRSILERAFYLPNILGLDVEFQEGTTIMISGNEGLVISTIGEDPWGTTKPKWGSMYSELMDPLGELNLKIYDAPRGEFTPARLKAQPKLGPPPDYSGSNKLLIIILMYSVIMGLILIVLDLDFTLSFLVMMFFLDAFLLFGVALERSIVRINPCCSWMIFLIGLLVIVMGISSILVDFDVSYVIMILLGVYIILTGVPIYVTRKERMRK